MRDVDRTKLLFGPYQAPPLKNGARTFCLYRQQAVIVTTWSDARIPWPRCYLAEGRARAHGLLVDEELARAIRHESAAAVGHWWGVSRNTVRRWRGALGVGHTDNEGTHRLVRVAIQANMDSRPYGGRLWTLEETALVGALPDGEVARRTGRSRTAVIMKRRRLKRPRVRGRRAAPRTRTERED
ncbi:MAG TPA: hypothetical protein VJ739_12190 [Gemmataceae bacterium]|nr:hypothetical protein [Gemmataceae bacterium]